MYGWHHVFLNESAHVDIWPVPKLFYYHKQCRGEHNKGCFYRHVEQDVFQVAAGMQRGARVQSQLLGGLAPCAVSSSGPLGCTPVDCSVANLILLHPSWDPEAAAWQGAEEQWLRAREDCGGSAGAQSQSGGCVGSESYQGAATGEQA